MPRQSIPGESTRELQRLKINGLWGFFTFLFGRFKLVFKATINGEADPNINIAGRPRSSGEILTNRKIREKELLLLLRKLKPHVASSITTAAGIMGSKSASDQNKLKGAVIILKAYTDLVGDVYGEDEEKEEDTVEEVQPQTPGAQVHFFYKPEEKEKKAKVKNERVEDPKND